MKKILFKAMLLSIYLVAAGRAGASVMVIPEIDTGSQLETVDPYRYAFDTLATLSATDLAQSATFSQVVGTKHAVSGPITVLQDGKGAPNNNAVAANYFSDMVSRFLIDLGQPEQIAQFNSYSYHVGSRTPQRYDLYGSITLGSPTTAGAAGLSGYTLITNVTEGAQVDGQLGVSVLDSGGGAIGTYRYLVMDILNLGTDGGTFFSEIDVVAFVVPEPGTVLLVSLGGLLLWVVRKFMA